MPIPRETLNGQLRAYDVHTGVYQSHARRTAIVVKVGREGQVYYVTLTENFKILLVQSFREKFLADFPIELYHYPVLRAVRSYARAVRTDHAYISDEARKVLNAILTRR